MSDDVILPGTGEPVKTDEIGGAHYQRIKVTDGQVDSAVHMRVRADHPLFGDAGAVVRQAPCDIWSVGFAASGSSLLAPEFTQRRLGTGHGVTQGSSNLLVTTGTTTNSEFLARSVQSFRGALISRAKTILSQRIINQNFVVMLADRIGEGLAYTINSATSVTVTQSGHPFTAESVGQFMFLGAINGAAGVPGRYAIASVVAGISITFTVAGWPASGSGTLDLFGHNYIRAAYSGTVATNVAVDAQRRGWNSGDTTATINTTASPGHVLQFYADGRNINFADTVVATSTTPTVTTRASRIENIPDDDAELFLYLWSFNGTTAPASTTTWTVGFVAVEDLVNVPTFIAGVRPLGAQAALPVTFPAAQQVSFPSAQAVTLATLPALTAGTALAGDVAHQYRANATGAASRSHLVSAASTNATSAKASAGRLLGWNITNTNAAIRYVKLHNIATAPTAGTGVVQTIGVPPTATVNYSLEGGIAFATGIGFTTVTGSADADATAVGAGDLIIDLFFA
jgi:hypothetical protein